MARTPPTMKAFRKRPKQDDEVGEALANSAAREKALAVFLKVLWTTSGSVWLGVVYCACAWRGVAWRGRVCGCGCGCGCLHGCGGRSGP